MAFEFLIGSCSYLVFLMVVCTIPSYYVEVHRHQESTRPAGLNRHIIIPKSTFLSIMATFEKKSPARSPRQPFGPHLHIPKSFDARDKWPECASIIGNIQDQGACASCWAFAATGVMNDRICIHSNAAMKVKLSVQDLISCCSPCSSNCNMGGLLYEAFRYWKSFGIVTGGGYRSGEGCKSYTFAPINRFLDSDSPTPNITTPGCVRKCDEGSKLIYEDDLFFGSAYSIPAHDIHAEILLNGPVAVILFTDEDFHSHKSGIYKVSGNKVENHSVRIIGWGVENGIEFWRIANSYGVKWGDEGFFKIIRGKNEAGIENDIYAGIPNVW